MSWQYLVINILSNALLIGTATAILNYYFNRKLENLKKDTSLYLMKSQTLHVKRAEAIELIYTKLERAIRYIADVMHPLQFGGDENFEIRIKEAGQTAQEFKEIYSGKRVYLTPSLAKKLDKIDNRMNKLWHDFIRSHPKLTPNNTEKFEKWDTAWKAFSKKEIPVMLKSLEREFRQILGSNL